MRLIFILTILTLLLAFRTYEQVIIPDPVGIIVASTMPEHGFLPGKKFPFYSTIDKFDFRGLKLRVELFDDRERLNLKKIGCSEIDFTNTLEFADPQCIYKVSKYIDTLFKQSGAVLDLKSKDTFKIRRY